MEGRPDDVVVVAGRHAAIPIGFGTMASRSTVTVSGAIHHASERLREKTFAIAANLLECAPPTSNCATAASAWSACPARRSAGELAQAARPGWDHGRPPGIDAGLEETYYWEPPTVTWSYATTRRWSRSNRDGRVKIEQYAIAHDCGVRGQPDAGRRPGHGRHVQGLGGTLGEGIAYDGTDSSYRDANGLRGADRQRHPGIEVVHQQTPSPLNPLGVKGLGEGGAIAPPVTIANAVCDALWPFGIELNETPIRPESLIRNLSSRQR